MRRHVPFNQGSLSAHRTNWSVGLPAVLADLSFCLAFFFPLTTPPRSFFFFSSSWSSHSQFNTSSLATKKANKGWKTCLLMIWVVFLASVFLFLFFFPPLLSDRFFFFLEIPHSPVGRWLPARADWRDLAWHWLPAGPWNEPVLRNMMDGVQTQLLLLSEQRILSWYTPIIRHTFARWAGKMCSPSTLNRGDKSESQPAHATASLLLSMIGRKCKTHLCSHWSMHNFALILVLFTLDVLGVVREG